MKRLALWIALQVIFPAVLSLRDGGLTEIVVLLREQ